MRQAPSIKEARLILIAIHQWIQNKGYAPGIVNTDPEWHSQQVSVLRSQDLSSEFTVGDPVIYKLLFSGDLDEDYVFVYDINGMLQQALTDEINAEVRRCMAA